MIPHSEERANAPRVAIVGAGVSGIAVARALRNADIEFTIFEKASEAGGTWRDNVYPGLKCDVPLLS
jgi:cation diffusion facilitator CzcD-associated flavoprotein CzcO